MAMENRRKIGLCLLAIALFGTVTMPAGFAEEAGQRTHDDADGAKSSARQGSSQSPYRENAASVHDGQNSDPIDTRISVQPRRPVGKPGKVGDARGNFQPPPIVSNPHRRTFLASSPVSPVLHNAIGLPVPQHESVVRLGGQRTVAPLLPHLPTTPQGPVASVSGGLARGGAYLERPAQLQLNANPIVKPTALSRGTVNGTSLPRHGIAVSGRIGGPSRTVAGINGSTIRSTH